MTGEGTYLYAVARALPAGTLADIAGIGGRPVRAVPVGALSCVVSSVDLAEFDEQALSRNLEDVEWLARVARQHDAVVSAIGRRCATLPLRLATIYHDDVSAAVQVGRRLDAALEALDRVDGRDEWGVKVFDVPPAEPVAATRPASGADYLNRRRAELQEHETARTAASADAAAVYEELAGLAAAGRRHRPQDPQLSGHRHPMLLNAAFLVERSAEEPFRAAVDRLAAARPPGTIVLTGPWPPYSFVEWTDP